ncbi:MAG: hypothetical protein JSR17_04460 [Proteobacteria bacterium]|nr:hypothetical protein [Pseudomonadota bacterium]
MLDGLALPVVCAANLCSCTWFVHLKEIMNHSLLNDDEKYLWCWLASQCANQHQLTCSFSYEQISTTLNKPPYLIHRCLFRLRTMGFLQGNIPIWYAQPLPEMIKEMRQMKVLLPRAYHPPTLRPLSVLLQCDKLRRDQVQGVVLPRRKGRGLVSLNLLKN